MASEEDLKQFNRLRSGPAPLALIQRLPPIPDDIKQRFPSAKKWEDQLEKWRVEANTALGGGAS